MMNLMLQIAVVVCLLFPCSLSALADETAPSPPVVRLCGPGLDAVAAVWKAAGVDAQAVAAAEFPTDPAALAREAGVWVLHPDVLTHPDAARAVEAYVRAGGGLWLDAGPEFHKHTGTPADWLAPAVALDAVVFGQVPLQPSPDSPLAGLAWDRLGRMRSVQAMLLPDRSRLGLMNKLSPLVFGKPVWNCEGVEWLTGPPPQRDAVMVAGRYGAGRVAAGGFALTDPAWRAWADFAAFARLVAGRLDGRETLDAAKGDFRPLPTVGWVGEQASPPEWWAKPFRDGLAGMGQKRPFETFLMLTPETFVEAGFWPLVPPGSALAADAADRARGPADIVLCFGPDADKPAPDSAKVVLRAPSANFDADPPAWNAGALKTVAETRHAMLAGAEVLVNLPFTIPATDDAWPVFDAPAANGPLPELPAAWRVRLQPDPDSDRDLAEGWHKPDYDDADWEAGGVGERVTTLFGQPNVGYDGAWWYRTRLDVPAAARVPDAALLLQARAHHVAVYVDGEEIALEPQRALVPLSKLSAGSHLLAVRVYGELRANKGLIDARIVRLPAQWRPDPDRAGWVEQWFAPETPDEGWTPVSESFGSEPVGQDAQEGWFRRRFVVPENAPPFELVISTSLNLGGVAFLNGQRLATLPFDRSGLYRFRIDNPKPGVNTLVVWTRCEGGFQGMNVNVSALASPPPSEMAVRATLNSPRAGLGVLARVTFNPRPQAFDADLFVNDRTVGGWIDSDGDVLLYAPRSLAEGDNEIAIRLSRHPGTTVTVRSLAAVEEPEGMPLRLPGWKKLAVDPATPTATPDCSQDSSVDSVHEGKWTPAGWRREQMIVRSWECRPVPAVNDEDHFYRTRLLLSADDLKRPLTLELEGPVDRLYVNGNPVERLEERYFPLNAHLHVGMNVLQFRPDYTFYRNLNLLVPPGRPRGVYFPVLHFDRAVITPAEGRWRWHLPTFGRTFRKPDWTPPKHDEVLYTFHDGSPAVVMDTTTNANTKTIHFAPGLLDDVLPGPEVSSSRHMVNGSADTNEYDYAQRLNRDLFDRDRFETLLARIARAVHGDRDLELGAKINGIRPYNGWVMLFMNGNPPISTLVWRVHSFDGAVLAEGHRNAWNLREHISLPDLDDETIPAGGDLGRTVTFRAALLSPDRRQVLDWLEEVVPVQPEITLALRTVPKYDRLDEHTGPFLNRLLHWSADELAEGQVFLPDEPVSVEARMETWDGEVRGTLTIEMIGPDGERRTVLEQPFKMPPRSRVRFALDPSAIPAGEGAYRLVARFKVDDRALEARAAKSINRVAPRGNFHDRREIYRQDRTAGGYMWTMYHHAYNIEHRLGYDARPVPGASEWWTRVRQAGDGNWMVANGVHRGENNGDHLGLMWGPFYDQTRGEVMDSFGWFPNGMAVREWWWPSAMREVLRRHGRRSVRFDLSDWWQYDSAAPIHSYNTLEHFNRWLVHRDGQTVAGVEITGGPVVAGTIEDYYTELRRRHLPGAFEYWLNEQMLEQAVFTGTRINAVAPGSAQSGQGGYSHRLPGVTGGASLGPEWSRWEVIGILDADNHPFAQDWQYAIEGINFRSLGTSAELFNHWERPMRYHRVVDVPSMCLPLDTAAWRRRQLDSRWTLVAQPGGGFAPVINVTHGENRLDVSYSGLIHTNPANIGSGMLPAHWRVNDRLSALCLTIGAGRPRSPLLLVGESDLDWTRYFGTIGKFRDAGLPIGGGVNVSLLDAMNPADIPALVWLPGDRVDANVLAAVGRKLRAGVPVLMIGKIPAPIGTAAADPFDPAVVFGLERAPDAPTDARQWLADEVKDWPAVRGAADSVAGVGRTASAWIVTDGADMKPLATRGGRLAVGQIASPDNKAVVYPLMYPLGDREDTQLRVLAVEAFLNLCGDRLPLRFPEGATGYVFDGLDGATYVVLQNLQNRPAVYELPPPAGKTGPPEDVLHGRTLSPTPTGVTVPLGPHDATVLRWTR